MKTNIQDAPVELAIIEEQSAKLPAVQQTGALDTSPPMGMMLRARELGISAEQIREMMVIEREYRADQTKAQFRDAFAAFRGENIIIPKGKFVDRGKAGSFNQAEYDQVCSRLSPALSRHGFGFRHDQKFGSVRRMFEGAESDIPWIWVTCFLEHKAGHAETLELEGPIGESSANTPVQNMQATASYLKRQSLLAITGTATGGEDDENKLRAKQPKGESGHIDALRDAGQAASMEGLKSLTAWWGSLTARDRSELQKEYPSLRRAAVAADEDLK